MGLGIGLGLGRGGRVGVAVPTILLSNSSIAENAANGTTIGTLSVINGSGTYTFTETADPDAKFGVTGTNLNKTAAIDYETATSHSVTIHADNGAGSTVDRTFTIAVTNINEAPTVANALVDQNATEDSAFSYQFASNSFTDPDAGTTLTYSASLSPSGSLPAWLSFNPSTRTFSGTPTTGDVGTITVRVTASDGSLTVTDDFTITTTALSVSAVTWNPADKDGGITLSSGNLTATHPGSGAFSAVRGTSSRSAGKYMIEYELITGGWDGALVGFGSATASLSQFVGQNNQSLGLIDVGSAQVYTNNASLVNLGTAVNMANGNRVAFAIDFDADKLWVQTEGSGWIGASGTSGDPAAGTNGIDVSGFLGAVSGPVFPMMNGFYTGDSVTLVPGTFQHTIPSGFLAWDATAVAPILTWDGETTDTTPDFLFDFDEDSMVVGTVITWEVYSDSGLTTLVDTDTHTLTSPEKIDGSVILGMGPLSNGSYWVRVKEDVNDLWSNTEAITISAPTTTFDPANKSAGTALSSGNLVATTTTEWNWENVLGTTTYSGSGAKSWTVLLGNHIQGNVGFSASLPGAGLPLDDAAVGAATDAVIMNTNNSAVEIKVNGTSTGVVAGANWFPTPTIAIGDSIECEMNGNNFRCRLLKPSAAPSSWSDTIDVTTYGVVPTSLKPSLTFLDEATGTPSVRTADFSNW